MHLAVGTKVTFQASELTGLISSEILDLSINNISLGRERAYLLSFFREDAAEHIKAVSSSGYTLYCLSIVEGEWEFEVSKAPELQEET